MSALEDKDYATIPDDDYPILQQCTTTKLTAMSKQWTQFLKACKSDPHTVLKDKAFHDSVGIGGQILAAFLIARSEDTIGFDGKPLNLVGGEFQILPVKCLYGDKEVKYLSDLESAMASEIEEEWQRKMKVWKNDGSPAGKKPTRGQNIKSPNYFACRVAATTPGLLRWKDRYNETREEGEKIDVQSSYHKKAIKDPVQSLLDKNKKEILDGDAKFDVVLKICKQVESAPNIHGHHSKIVIGTDFPTIGAVYMAVSYKSLYFISVLSGGPVHKPLS